MNSNNTYNKLCIVIISVRQSDLTKMIVQMKQRCRCNNYKQQVILRGNDVDIYKK